MKSSTYTDVWFLGELRLSRNVVSQKPCRRFNRYVGLWIYFPTAGPTLPLKKRELAAIVGLFLLLAVRAIFTRELLPPRGYRAGERIS
jgi:hypothetical protein